MENDSWKNFLLSSEIFLCAGRVNSGSTGKKYYFPKKDIKFILSFY